MSDFLDYDNDATIVIPGFGSALDLDSFVCYLKRMQLATEGELYKDLQKIIIKLERENREAMTVLCKGNEVFDELINDRIEKATVEAIDKLRKKFKMEVK